MAEFISGKAALLRDMNRSICLDSIRKQGPISQADLAKMLDLQPSTILRIVKDLENEGLIYQSGIGEVSRKGGRKASLWDLNAKGALAIGVDLGTDHIITVLVDLVGNAIGQIRVECPSDQPYDVIMEQIYESIEKLLSEQSQSIEASRIIGIGVGLPGKVDSNQGISRYALNFPNWKDVPVAKLLREKFNLPVFIEGDMKLLALGEKWYGAGMDARNILCIGFRRGIGLGIVANNEVYKGSHETSGDIGHVIVDPNGTLCYCGRRGCLEAIASQIAIVNWAKEYIKRNGTNAFNGVVNSAEEVSIEKIYQLLEEDNFLVVNRIKECGRYLGRVLCDLVRVFDPDIMIIGGRILEVNPVFLETVIETFKEEQPSYAKDIPDVLLSKLSDHGVAFGAAVMILSRLFKL